MPKNKVDDDSGISRRDLLARSGAAAAGAAFAASGAQALPTEAPVRIGSGYWTYELVPGWGTLPAPMHYEWGCAIVVDHRDNVYVHTRAKQSVAVFNRHGKLLRTFGAEFAGTGHGLYLHKEGPDEFLYFTDHPRNMVVKTDLDGKVLMRIGDVASESTTMRKFAFNQPTDLAINKNGDIYVCEGYGGQRIVQFDQYGKHIRTIGAAGTGPEQFNCCHGIWVDTRKHEPEIYIADRNNARVQVYSEDLKLKRSLVGDVRNPCCFYQHKGKMYIPDLDHRVTILDENDKAVAQLGDGRSKVEDATFEAPHAMAVDSHGDMYVVEWRLDARLRKLRHTPQMATA